MNKNDKTTPRWYETLTFKMALLGFMAIMFLVPLQMILMVTRERQKRSDEVKKEIASKWGETQIVSGPVLNVPYYQVTDAINPGTSNKSGILHIMPADLLVICNVEPQVRYMGIYEAVIYESEVRMEGHFDPDLSILKDRYLVSWDEAWFTIGVSDNRGIKDQVYLDLSGNKIEARPGVSGDDIFASGIRFPVGEGFASGKKDFSIAFSLRGSSGIYFTPVGKTTHVTVKSPWIAPSFSGLYLPQEREISDTGFTADWEITNLNRNFPQEWIGSGFKPEEEAFGVDFILQADHYQKTERSIKYGMLFIALTFMALLFLELSSKENIHFFCYFLISLALVLFFSLLVSLSEQVGFVVAYIISSAATISLVSWFTGALMRRISAGIIVGAILVVLYLFIYILLTLKEFSFLAGNIGLFAALAAIMVFTSRTDLFRKSLI